MVYRRLRFIHFLYPALLALIISPALSADTLHAQDTAPLRVIASFSILGDVVQNVAGDTFQVETLTPAGVDPHSFSPSPRDVVGIAEAEIVFINGAGFEQTLLETIENAGGDPHLVVVSACVPILALGGHTEDAETHTESIVTSEASEASEIATRCETHHHALDNLTVDQHDADELEHHHDPLYLLACGAEGDHEDEESDHEGHDHGPCDPHVWTDPANVILWVYSIRDALSAADPANAETYQRNADAYIAQIMELNENTLKPLLQSVPEDRRVLITNHETMSYFAEAYGFEIAETVIPGGATASQLSVQDVIKLIEFVRSENIPAIFAENTVNAAVAEQIASESGAQFYTLLSDSLGTTPGVDSTYLEYLRYNAQTIAQALGESSD